MQITEQLIERIARRVFNSMFAPALRQSNVQGGGTSGSVRYADEAGHAASADTATSATTATTAGSADAVAWSGVTGKPSFATVATSGSYNDLSNKPSIPTASGLHSGYAANADYAVTAGSATSAGYATNAGYATSAGNADTVDGYHESAFLHRTGGTMTGNIYIGNTTIYASGSNGSINSLAVSDDCILGDCNIGGHLGLKSLNTNNAGISFYSSSGSQVGQLSAYNGNIGIGTDSPSYKLHVVGKIYCTGGFGFLSDIRKKNILKREPTLSVDEIADAPLIYYTLKGDCSKQIYVGSVAQYWDKVLPETVNKDDEGTLSMQYDVQALTSAVILARRVRELEAEVKIMKDKIYGKQ